MAADRRPMRRVNEVFAFGCDCGGIYLDRKQLNNFSSRFAVQTAESNVGRHHVSSRSPTERDRRTIDYETNNDD